MSARREAIAGAILGAAVGDALGLPYEGLSPRRAARLLGEPDRYRLLPGRGMVSDDTEHACAVMQSLIAAGDDPQVFTRQLAWRLRLWLLGLPAGIGWATVRAILKLWLGFPASRSGVFSAGNGPAMRSPVLGAAVDDLDLLKRLVRISTRITHTDPKAEYGALAVALAARLASDGTRVEPENFASELQRFLHDEPAEELFALVERVIASQGRGDSTASFAASLGLGRGVSGYIYHTVPVVLHAWLAHQTDYRLAITSVIRCGGDTDTTAAILGGLVGSAVGIQGIPRPWLAGLWERPRSAAWMEELAYQLWETRVRHTPSRPARLPAAMLLPRNLLFLFVVLGHGIRRLLPPY